MLYVTIIIVFAIIAATICFCVYYHNGSEIEAIYATKLEDIYNITQAKKDKKFAYNTADERDKYKYIFSDSEIEELINVINDISNI